MLPYRRCVAIFLMKGMKVFVGERISLKDAWQLPQGGVEDGESDLDAAKRELFEETGVRSIELLASCGPYKYDFPRSIRQRILKKRGQLAYAGQDVTFFAFNFIGNDKEIDLQKYQQEFFDWKWVLVEDLLQKIVYFKKPVYELAVEEFKKSKLF